jgi:hypothetical protein
MVTTVCATIFEENFMEPNPEWLIGQTKRAQRRGRTLIEILMLIGALGVIVAFLLLSSISRIKKTPYRGKTIEFEWSKDLVNDEPAVRAEAVTILCEAMQDKDRAVR